MKLSSSFAALVLVALMGVAAVGDSGPHPAAVTASAACLTQGAAGACAQLQSRWQVSAAEVQQVVANRTTSVLADFPDQ